MAFLKILYPGMRIKRWFFLFAGGVVAAGFSLALLLNYRFIGLVEGSLFSVIYKITGNYYGWISTLLGAIVLCIGLTMMFYAMRRIIRSIIDAVAPEGANRLVDIMYQKRRLEKGPSVVVIGGGTGLSTLLRGLKKQTGNLTAIVTVADDGGSSGRLREELGIVPPGDLRSCLVALADTEPLMEKLFQYRFIGAGDLTGHSFGNLFIAAMTQVVGGDVELALQESSKVLAVRGQVLPASARPVKISARMTDGTIINGESNISCANKRIQRVTMEPSDVPAVQSALNAIRDADIVVLGPGSLYTSVIPNLLVGDIVQALRNTRAMRVYVCNVMTQPGETDHYTASDHVKALFDHGGQGIVDYVLVNVEEIASCLLDHYAREGACPVKADIDELEQMGVTVIPAQLVNESNWVRHDPERLAQSIFSMMDRRRKQQEK
ncbi:MAG: uridine diphosphate-N-acetylglucosamine-binding protein YvcK [Negativicutes bacterium]